MDLALLVGVLVAAVIFMVFAAWIIWRAVGAGMDWVIYTVGNERAVEDLVRRREKRKP